VGNDCLWLIVQVRGSPVAFAFWFGFTSAVLFLIDHRSGGRGGQRRRWEKIGTHFVFQSFCSLFYLWKGDSAFIQRELASRREQARSWYAPKALEHYDLYRDATSVGYAHMLVQKEAEPDGRQRVFISKH
jgi:hypothetical protein